MNPTYKKEQGEKKNQERMKGPRKMRPGLIKKEKTPAIITKQKRGATERRAV
jgi:hypothetical protein